MDFKDTIDLFKKRLDEKESAMMAEKSPLSNVEVPQKNGQPLGKEDIPSGIPVEWSDMVDGDILDVMHTQSSENSSNAKADGFDIIVSPKNIVDVNGHSIKYFDIADSDDNSGKNDYTVYLIDDKVYYRPTKEFKQLLADVNDSVAGRNIESFKNKYSNIQEPLDTVYSVTQRDDCLFVICSIFSSITGKSYDNLLVDKYVDESCKVIRHTRIGTDYSFKKSLLAHDAKYGSADSNAFKREIEDKQKQDNTVGALDNAQQESENTKSKLPNVHRKMVSESICGVDVDAILEAKSEDIYYEPHDRVLVKTVNGDIPGMVTDVYDSLDYGQIITVMCQGSTLNVTTKEVKPDMSYLVNQLADYTDEFSDIAFQLDKESRLNKKVENDKKDYSKEYKDLNDINIECDIVVNGFKVNYEKTRASLKDIATGNKFVKVIKESGAIDMWPIQNVKITEDNWPYAVIVSGTEDSEEPVRKIRIDPQSYVDAHDDEALVDCILGDERTQIKKKFIRIIS